MQVKLPSTRLLPGLLVASGVALVAWFVASHYGGPQLLYALLMGMAFHHLSALPRYQAGIQFASRNILRIGVALLGIRITFAQIMALGYQPPLLVILGVPLTILFALWLSKFLGLTRNFGLLTGGSVAICGASAAIAVSCVLPRDGKSEDQLVFAVVAVTTLSTIAMIVYPIISQLLDFDAVTAGIFLGGTIHDVAQVVGAGYLLGEQAGNTATFTKLLRVAMLVPVVMVITLWLATDKQDCTDDSADHAAGRPPLLPMFLVVFLLLVVINSVGWVPTAIQSWGVQLSNACLVTAIAAIGIKASVADLAAMGWKPLLLMVGETLFLGVFVMLGLLLV